MKDEQLQKTPLYELHQALGGKLVPFAGYALPVQYGEGIIKEHLHTRAAAGLFDVSHMGQIEVSGAGCWRALERLLPVELETLPTWRQRYALLTADNGGIRDDLMVLRVAAERFLLVVNAACKAADLAYLAAELTDAEVRALNDRALLALQGPQAEAAAARLWPDVAELRFMQGCAVQWRDHAITITRSGYTGEDGFEISVPAGAASQLARELMGHSAVKPAGLGARDTLRLEAGLCLYGHDIDLATTPVEAALQWSISRSRRPDGDKAGGYPGAEVIGKQLQDGGAARRRIGLRVEGRAPLREGAALLADGQEVGHITSGGHAPSLGAPVAMGYVATELAEAGTRLQALQRGRSYQVTVTALPFVAPGYRR